MGNHRGFSFGLFLMILAVVLFFIAAVAWPAPVEPYRAKLIAAGLFCWSLSTFF
jgi:hypothetical protein